MINFRMSRPRGSGRGAAAGTRRGPGPLRPLVDFELPGDEMMPMFRDNGQEISHVYFDANGLVDTRTLGWIAATKPPVQKISAPIYAGASVRNSIGPYSVANYFTAGTLFNFPAAPWMAAIEYDHVNSGLSENLLACLGGATEGWTVNTVPGAGPYLLTGSFDGPQAPTMAGLPVVGRNTVIVGWDGADLMIKSNSAKVITKTQVYTAGAGTSYVGRYGGGQYYSGGLYEIWGAARTPTVDSINALYALSRRESGNNYRFPQSADARFHLHSKNIAANVWTYYPTDYAAGAPPTLTTVGTVPVSTTPLLYASADGRYGIVPSGNPAPLTPDTSMYYLVGGAANVLNIATSFYGAMIVVPTAGALATTSIYLSSGYASVQGGYQLVNEDSSDSPGGPLETVFIGSTGQITGPICVADKLNIICYGWDATNGKAWLKVNDAPSQSKTMTITAVTPTGDRRDQAQLAGHNNMDIGNAGSVYEMIMRRGAPTDELFCALQREVLCR